MVCLGDGHRNYRQRRGLLAALLQASGRVCPCSLVSRLLDAARSPAGNERFPVSTEERLGQTFPGPDDGAVLRGSSHGRAHCCRRGPPGGPQSRRVGPGPEHRLVSLAHKHDHGLLFSRHHTVPPLYHLQGPP